jgi:hypothetical protein
MDEWLKKMNEQFDDLMAYNTALFEGLGREIHNLGESLNARIDFHHAQRRLCRDEKFREIRELILGLGGDELRQRLENLEHNQN